MNAIGKNNDGAVKLLLDKGASVHVQSLARKETVLVSSGDRPVSPQLRLHVEGKFSQGEWLPAGRAVSA